MLRDDPRFTDLLLRVRETFATFAWIILFGEHIGRALDQRLGGQFNVGIALLLAEPGQELSDVEQISISPSSSNSTA